VSNSDKTTISPNSSDLLWRQLKSIPAFRALLRSVEARFYIASHLPQPVLDIGCGDGHFAEVTFKEPITAGIDPWWGPLRKAQASQKYLLPMQAMGDFLPFADHAFASAFSNSVLEHIPDIQPVLNEVSRVLQPGAPFVLTVPSHYFTEFLAGAGFLESLGLNGMADSYRTAFNRISRHAHTDPPEVWNERLALAGFTIERWQYYFSKDALRALEIGHAQGLPSAILHALTSHWILGPWEKNLKWTEQWIRPYYEEEFPQQGAYLYFLARKIADKPLEAGLPQPRPYALSDLLAAAAPPTTEIEPPGEDNQSSGVKLDGQSYERETPPSTTNKELDSSRQSKRYLVPGILVALTLLFASLGQSALRATPQEPGDGIRWLIFSAGALLLLLWFERSSDRSGQRTWHWPDISAIPKQRWLYFPALLLSFTAYRWASSSNQLNPIFAFAIWVGAMALAYFALGQEEDAITEPLTQRDKEARLFTIRTSVLLFLGALVIRIYDLANHPFILNGTEASLGLEALNVINGFQTNPFGSGWLTNPSLPFFLLAVPIRLLGPSVESLRLLSAIIGALTVPVLFIIGQQLYNRAAGIVAAILLAGSHFHIHFSRLGLTNAWDALLILLALGLIAIAWQQAPQHNRRTWLLAGTAVGFNAYLYTSSHLLPIMLLALALILLLLDRTTIKKQWRHILAMAALALLVAFPQLLYYQASPGIFMERANALGILESQSGWLGQEAARTGLSQLELLNAQFWQAALAFNATIDTGTSYGPLVPFLNFLFGVLAVLGFILAIFRLRQIRFSILIVWILVTVIFAGALLENPPNSHRFIIAMPAVCLLAAVALNDLLGALSGQAINQSEPVLSSSGKKPLFHFMILLVIAIAIALFDVGFYFGTYRQEHQFGDRNTEIADGVAEYLSSLDGQWVAHFYGPPIMYVDFPTIPFLARDFTEGFNLFNVPEAGSPITGYESGNQSFIILPERYNEIEQLRSKYPSGQEKSFPGYYADQLFYVFEVSGNT
jgi:SAM-dependent methyltransferase/4-amino-4-deoxy-L-arabinose transferase-like glycosyltransferase